MLSLLAALSLSAVVQDGSTEPEWQSDAQFAALRSCLAAQAQSLGRAAFEERVNTLCFIETAHLRQALRTYFRHVQGHSDQAAAMITDREVARVRSEAVANAR